MILLLSAAGVLGGAERVLLDWARALRGDVVLACPPGPLADAASPLEVVTLAHRPLQRRGRTIRAGADLVALARDIARLDRTRRPDVVVASGARPLLASALAPRIAAPLVAIVHDAPLGGLPGRALARAARRADAVVATSAAIAPPGATVIHPGVDLAAWALPEPPAGPPRALVVGALVPWKRPGLALEIAARVPELRLDLAGAPLPGDPPELAAGLRERAARPDLAGRVRFLGALDDVRPALAEAHVLLHCADHEPFGLALVEALAAGRPVVAPAGGGPLEIVTPAAGRLYPPGDPDGGAAALRAALADPGLRAGARERARSFAAQDAAQRFAALLGSLMADR